VSSSQVSRLPASSPRPRRQTTRGVLLYPCMSTLDPYSHPSFFPTHAIVREKLHPVYRSRLALTHCLTFIIGTPPSSPLPLLPLVGPCVRRHRGGHRSRAMHESPRSPQGQFQVSTRGPEGGIGRGIWLALRDIHASEGWRGLYRGLSPNIAGNASSWGLYFLLYVCFFGVTRSCRIRLSPFAENFFLYSWGPLPAHIKL